MHAAAQVDFQNSKAVKRNSTQNATQPCEIPVENKAMVGEREREFPGSALVANIYQRKSTGGTLKVSIILKLDLVLQIKTDYSLNVKNS